MKYVAQRISPLLLVLLFACSSDDDAGNAAEPGEVSTVDFPVVTSFSAADLQTIATNFEIPWGIEILSENEFLVTERTGALYHFLDGAIQRVSNIPASRTVEDQFGIKYGGMMDVSLHPEYASNNLVYITYVANDFKLKVARFELVDDTAVDIEVIFGSQDFSIGSRIAWPDSEHFFLSLGVGGSPFPDPGPQNLNSDLGKIHRLMSDGSVPEDNPILPGATAPTSIWTYGHRNPQGLWYDEDAEILYANEHGPLGGDELNIILKGENYGWPLFSYGLNYDNSAVSNMTEEEAAESTQLPIKHWTSSFRVAPSGLLMVEDSNIESWNGSFLMGALSPQDLLRYNMQTDETEIVLRDVGRVRDIAQLPGGDFLMLIDARSPNQSETGRVVRVMAK